MFDRRTKLLVVASTCSPLQGHILYSPLPRWPPLTLPGFQSPPPGLCTALPTPAGLFLPPLSLSFAAILSLAPSAPEGFPSHSLSWNTGLCFMVCVTMYCIIIYELVCCLLSLHPHSRQFSQAGTPSCVSAAWDRTGHVADAQ